MERDKAENLHELVRANNVELVKRALENGADVNTRARNDELDTPLHTLAGNRGIAGNRIEMAELLLSHGADVNAQNDLLETPLHASAGCSHEMTELLLSHGADVNAKDYIGETPLIEALVPWAGDLDSVTALLENGADPNARRHDSSPAIALAGAYGNPNLISALLKYGADVNAKDNNGQTALHYAWQGISGIFEGRPDATILLLASGVDVDARDNYGRTPLYIVASSTHVDVAAALLLHCADPHIRVSRWMTPYRKAILTGHPIMALLMRVLRTPRI